MGTVVILLLAAAECGLVMLSVLAGFAMGRRPHFWARVSVGCVFVPALGLVVALVVPPAVVLILIGGLIAVPAWSCQSLDPPPGPSDEGHGRDWSGPDRPPGSPERPRGGVPLPDADPSRIRVRDHTKSKVGKRGAMAFA